MAEIKILSMVVQIVTFLIALFVVWKLGWKTMVNALTERQKNIAKSLDAADAAKKAVEKLESDYKAKLKEIEQKSSELIIQARHQATQARDEIVKNAQSEADAIRKKAEDQAALDRQQMIKDLRQEIVTLSIAVAEKALGELVEPKTHTDRFTQILEELDTVKKAG